MESNSDKQEKPKIEAKLDESLISTILNKNDLESLKDNLANLSGIMPSTTQITKIHQVGEEKKSSKKNMLVKRNKRKRKIKKVLPYHERTLADIIDDKISGKPTKADVRTTLLNHFKAARAKKKLKSVSREVKQEEKIVEKNTENLFLEDRKIATLADFFTPSSPQKKKKKSRLPTKWDEKETKLFYKVLETLGLDFTLMEQFFVSRNRKQLLRKFHKEKKKNPVMIEKAMESHQKINESKRKRYQNFLDTHQNGSNLFSENTTSQDSLENTIHSKLKKLLEGPNHTQEENEIKPIDFYLSKIDKSDEEEKPIVKLNLEKIKVGSDKNSLSPTDEIKQEEESTTADFNVNSHEVAPKLEQIEDKEGEDVEEKIEEFKPKKSLLLLSFNGNESH